MKDKKGQVEMGWLIMVAVVIIVGLVIFQVIASYVASGSRTITESNTTRAAPTTGSCTDIQGYQDIIGTPIITNATIGNAVPSSNVSLVERVGTDGQLTVSLCTYDARYSGINVNITGTFGPDGYIENSGARAVTSLIILFVAVAIFIVAIPNLREYLDI